MKKGWYKKSFRRNLVDMHIADWSEEFLSKLSAEEYFANLKRANIQSAMIYFQNHNGHCYFPTKVGHVHAAFEKGENQIKKLVDLCHADGMDVIGYYSVVYNTYEEDRHPDWRLYGPDGKSCRERGGRYGHLCPNNPDYRAFVKTQIKEMLDYFDVEGMFYDMLFWPQHCNCDFCRARWKKETGLDEIPFNGKTIKGDPHLLYLQKKREWMGDFAKFLNDCTKEYNPDLTVESNLSQVLSNQPNSACSELVNDACDYAGGDLYGGPKSHVFAAKLYRSISLNQPFEYMTCRCDFDLYQHTVTKSETVMEREVMMNVANHGASFIIDAIDPVGTLDSRLYDRIGKIFRKEEIYEPYMHGEPISDVAIPYFSAGRYNSKGQGFTQLSCALGAGTVMSQNHVLYDVFSMIRNPIDKYKVVLGSYVTGATDEDINAIVSFVENGGTFYFSGAEEPALIERLLGAEFTGMSKHTFTYIAPKKNAQRLFGEFNAKYPMPIGHHLPIIKGVDPSEILAYITYPYSLREDNKKMASIHSNPPGRPTRIPALVKRKVGKGTVVWCAAPIELDERPTFTSTFYRLVDSLIPKKDRRLSTTAPSQVEINAYDLEDGNVQVNAINLGITEDRIKLPAFRVSIKTEKEPKALRCISTGKELPFTYRDGALTFTVKNLLMFEMFETK